ncbi:MAG TPA: putative Ig domain-containing protein [Bryobacteraceae bacterium]|nr:putative Ig domain-containing protein [Bryobacteraceae bacterium]
MRIHSRLPLLSPVFFLIVSLLSSGHLAAQSLTMVSGNGQMVLEQFFSQLPLVVQAKDASGHPMAGVTLNWAVSQGTGTLRNPTLTTDANGMASTSFLATTLVQTASFETEVITASSSVGNVNFFITTVLSRLPNGGLSAPPLVVLVTPAFENRNFSGASGSTIPGGVVVQVAAQSGLQQGMAVPNVGVRIINNQDPTQPSPAACAGSTGVVLTDSKGFATCDLVITGPPSTTQLTAIVGEIQQTSIFILTVTPGISCSYSLSAAAQSFAAAGGAGSVNVIAGQGCGWNAASNASFITVTSGASGAGNGPVGFSVAANSGAARTGTLTIAGQTFTVNQASATPGALAIATASTLPAGTSGSSYSTTLSATGGQPPYSWLISGTLPPGLAFNAPTATISGTAGAAGTYGFTATVSDSLGAQQSQNFSITINSATSGFSITNVSFASGVVGQAYQQALTTSGGCATPFSPMPAFSVSGGALPPGLIVQTNSDFSRSITGTPTTAGTFSFTLTATDACSKSVSAGYSITINGTVGTQQMMVNPTSVSFTVATGGANAPADQTVAVTSSSGVLNYNVAVATTSGGNWLVLRTAAAGNTPGSVTLGVANFAGLAAGTYNGTITITSSASNNPVVVPVSLTVVAVTATISVSPTSLTVSNPTSTTSLVTRRTLIVSSTATVHFTVTSSTTTGGNWLSVSPSQGDTSTSVLVTIDSGGLAAGAYNGSITVTPVGGAPQTIPVTLNVLFAAVLSGTPGALTFNYQQGATLPGSQLLTVGTTGPPVNVSIATVTQTGGNWLQVDRINGTAPLIVNVSVAPAGLSPGIYGGAVYVVAADPTITPLPINVSLTVSQTAPSIVSVTNGASFAPGPVSPGEIVTIFGGFMGPAALTGFQITPAGKLATILAGTQVFFDGFAAPIAYTSLGQVSAIVPYEITGQSTTQVQVKFLGVASNVLTVRVIDSSPGIFVLDASGQGAVLNQDNSVNSSTNGAAPDTIVSIFATGEGQTDPGGVDGSLGGSVLPLPRPRLPVTVMIDGLAATVLYAGAAPTLPAGVMQVNARVPTGVRRGISVPITIMVGTASSQSGVTIGIRP